MRALADVAEEILILQNVITVVHELEIINSVIVALKEVVEAILNPITTSDSFNCPPAYQQLRHTLA